MSLTKYSIFLVCLPYWNTVQRRAETHYKSPGIIILRTELCQSCQCCGFIPKFEDFLGSPNDFFKLYAYKVLGLSCTCSHYFPFKLSLLLSCCHASQPCTRSSSHRYLIRIFLKIIIEFGTFSILPLILGIFDFTVKPTSDENTPRVVTRGFKSRLRIHWVYSRGKERIYLEVYRREFISLSLPLLISSLLLRNGGAKRQRHANFELLRHYL